MQFRSVRPGVRVVRRVEANCQQQGNTHDEEGGCEGDHDA